MTEPAAPADVPPTPACRPARSRWLRSSHEVVWLFLLAGLVRALAAWTSPTILNDGVRLLESAERFVREGSAAARAGPDHPLVPWIVSLAPSGVDRELFATILCVLAGAFAVWPLHVLVRSVAGRHAATAACILYAALPKVVGVAATPLTSAVFLPLFLSGLSLAVVSRGGGRVRQVVRLAGAGAFCGLAYLCRPEGALVGPAAAVIALAVARPGRRLASGAIVLAAFVMVAAPYATALSRDAGHFVLTPKKDVAVFVGAADAARPPGDLSSAMRDAATDLLAALTIPVLLLALVGAFTPARWRDARSARPRIALLLLAAGFLAAIVRLRTGWGYGGARHALPAAMMLLPFAGEGLVFVASFIPKVVARRRLAVVIASYYAIPCVVNAVMRPEGADLADARRLGEAIAAEAAAKGEKCVVVATFGKPLVAYYADRALSPNGAHAVDLRLWAEFHELLDHPDADARRADLVKRLRSDGARWIVLDLFRATTTKDGDVEVRGRELAKRLTEDGAVGGRVLSPGSALTAFPVK